MFDFVRYLWDEVGVSADTISNYVSQVVSHFRLLGSDVDVPGLCRQLIHRLRQLPRESHFKEPVTRSVIWALATDESLDLGIRATVVIAWSLCLRLGQLVGTSPTSFDADYALLRRDCTVSSAGQMVRLHLRKGKTDVYNLGSVRHFMAAAPSERFCPVRLVSRFLTSTARFHPDEPLLRRSDGRIVTREPVVKVLKEFASREGIPAQHVSGHSLRVGAATSLKAGGASEADIMYWGQWASPSSMLRYVRASVDTAVRMGDALSVGPGPRIGLLQGEMVNASDRFPIGGLQPSDVLSSRPRR